MYTFTTNGKTVSIFPSSEANAPIIYLNTFSGEGQKVYEAAQAAGCPPFTLVAISDLDWNHDMAPWDSPPTFKNADPCTGGADDYLQLLTEEIIPAAGQGILAVQGRRSSSLAVHRRIFSGRAVCPLRHLPDGSVFPGGQHVRLPLVSRHEGVHLHP